MNYSELFAASLKKLEDNELSTAVQVLIEDSFHLSREQFWVRKNQPIRDANGVRRFRRRVRRLLAGEPLAYILKEKEFYGEKFLVTPAVLVPRPETELLVEKALALLAQRPARVLDIGAGSGNIAIVLALRSRATVTAVEKSRPALRILKKNIACFAIGRRVRPLAGDLFPREPGVYQLIVANPPYLSRREWRESPAGIRRFEPRAALVAGPAGTEVLARIAAGAGRWLAPGGHLLLEIGQGQRRSVGRILAGAGLRELECVRDYAGIDRVIVACR
ncbi:MAG TPA: peptide chain release factor N(5)-glutamine methyltransferase [Acidobacteriota bacterium]